MQQAVSSVSVRRLAASDLQAVADVHRAAFDRSVLTRLGSSTVERYYAWQLEGAHELYACGAFEGTELAGFCFGGIFPRAISGFLERHRTFLVQRLMLRPWLAADPLFARRLGRAVAIFKRRRSDARKQILFADSAKPKRPFDILSIAVRPQSRRLGVGRLLMSHAERVARENGYYVMTLVVNPDNDSAIRFYESLGWIRVPIDGVWKGNMERWFYGKGRTAP